jgi:hypothetical protein
VSGRDDGWRTASVGGRRSEQAAPLTLKTLAGEGRNGMKKAVICTSAVLLLLLGVVTYLAAIGWTEKCGEADGEIFVAGLSPSDASDFRIAPEGIDSIEVKQFPTHRQSLTRYMLHAKGVNIHSKLSLVPLRIEQVGAFSHSELRVLLQDNLVEMSPTARVVEMDMPFVVEAADPSVQTESGTPIR